MDTSLELVQDESAWCSQERTIGSKADNTWKVMFSKALASMKGLEKEITHKEWEIQTLKSRVKVVESDKIDQQIPPTAMFYLNEELPPPSSRMRDQESHANELRDLKSKLGATEAYLHQSLELNVKLEGEKYEEKRQQEVLTVAFDSLKSEVEAVLTTTEAFKAEAVHSMQALTSDVRRYQAASDQKLQGLRARVEKMHEHQSVQNGVLRTIAGEQQILHQISVARAAIQQTTTASLQHLLHLEKICGTKIQKAISLVETGRVQGLNNSREVPERIELLKGVAKKHKRDLTEAEKQLTTHAKLRRVGQNDGASTMELCFIRRNQEGQKILSLVEGQISLGHSYEGTKAGETSTCVIGTIQPSESCEHVDSYTAEISMQQNRQKFERSRQPYFRVIVAKRSPLL